MGVLKDIIEMIVLFTFIEGLIFSLFINKIGKMRYLKIREILYFAILVALCALFIPPIFRQIIMIIVICSYMHLDKFGNWKQIIKIVLLEFGFILVVETCMCMMLNMINLVDLTKSEAFNTFVFLSPIKIIEILLIIIGGKIIWVDSGAAKLKSQK